MVDIGDQRGRVRQIVLRPNASLSTRDAMFFLAGMTTVSMSIALVFMWLGFWMVLPFSGAELTLLSGCIYWVLRQNQSQEVITITDKVVQVERGSRLARERVELPLGWVKVNLKQSPRRGHPSSLSIRSHGREIVVGGFLVESEREQLAAELKQQLMWPGNQFRYV